MKGRLLHQWGILLLPVSDDSRFNITVPCHNAVLVISSTGSITTTINNG